MIKFLQQSYKRQLIKRVRRYIVALRNGSKQGQIQRVIRTQSKLQQILTKELKKKKKYKVAFFVVHASVWKLDEVYRLMDADDQFEPILVIIPYTIYGEKQMLKDMDLAYNLFQKKGYKVVKTYDQATESWLDIRQEIQPDIIFYTNPHELTKPEYYIFHFPDILSCYVQYSFHITHLHEMQYNQLFHNLIWKAFYETEIHRSFAQQYATNKGQNVAITGYAGTDVFLDTKRKRVDPWKIKDSGIKRIIWAPHHTIDDDKSFLSYSSFLSYADLMLELAKKYADKIQIAFKPHPILRPKLSDEKVWGQKRTDDYYHSWTLPPNTQLEESEYDDLFLTSDALIHDSASFMVEYLYLKKPVLYTLRDPQVTDRFNAFGKMAFEVHQHATNEHDIVSFIETSVLQEKDPKENVRQVFFNKYLSPVNGQKASANIINEIKHSI